MPFEQIMSIWGMSILTIIALAFIALIIYWVVKE